MPNKKIRPETSFRFRVSWRQCSGLFLFCVVLVTLLGPSGARAVDTVSSDHFEVNYGPWRGTRAYAVAASSRAEQAYQLLHQQLQFKVVPSSGKEPRYHVHVMTDLFLPLGKLERRPLIGPTETFIEIRGSLGTGTARGLAQTTFHEYFHAVTNCYLPYATVLGLDGNAKAEIWCIEGGARFMQYWGVSQFGSSPTDIDRAIDINPSLTDFDHGWFWNAVYKSEEGWLRGKTNRSLRTYNNGYPAFLFWYYLACNSKVAFDSGGPPGAPGVGVIRKFWEAMAGYTKWGSNHQLQTRKAMNTALGSAGSLVANFDGAFTEFTRSLAFPDQYYSAGRVRGLLQNMTAVFVQDLTLQGGTRTVSGAACAVEEMGARYFKLTNVPREELVNLRFESAKNGGYVASVYPGGRFTANPFVSLKGSLVCQIPGSEASGTVIVLTRLPGASGTKSPTLTVQTQQKPPGQGLLDVVLLVDKSGSMKDDIEVAKKEADVILSAMAAIARQRNISLRVGLVTFCYTKQGQVLRATPLTENVSVVRSAIVAIGTEDLGGDEDLYAALMYAMNKPVDGKKIEMGWRAGAAKVAFPITDEPAKEDNFTRARVADVAEKLDPVHIYPLLLPKSGSTFLSPAVRSMRALAAATDGQLVQVGSAGELPRAIVDSLKLAIRRHREEIWRRNNPPYLLYSMLAGICGLILFMLVFFVITQFRKRHGEGVLLVGYRRGILDGDLTGETSARRRSPPTDNSSRESRDPGRQG